MNPVKFIYTAPARAPIVISLKENIKTHAPIPITGTRTPIPSTLLSIYFNDKAHVPYHLPSGRFKTMKSTFFSQKYHIDHWFCSEKLDGIHAIWTGVSLLTRQGLTIHAPTEWISALPPNIALVGELYIGRGTFRETLSVVRRLLPDPVIWRKIQFWVFDIPDSKMTFEENYQLLNSLFSVNTDNALSANTDNALSTIRASTDALSATRTSMDALSVIRVIPQNPVANVEQFLSKHRSLVQQGAEGTVLRNPKSVYYVGLSENLLKYKAQMNISGELIDLYDRVAVIVGYNYSDKLTLKTGRPSIKSLQVRWSCDDSEDTHAETVEFSVSGRLNEEQKSGDYQSLFPIGAKIQILYNEIFENSGKPRFPRVGDLV